MLYQLSEKSLLNEIVIISNRELFDYGYRDSTNGKSITNFTISKTEEKPKQEKKTSLMLNNSNDNSLRYLVITDFFR